MLKWGRPCYIKHRFKKSEQKNNNGSDTENHKQNKILFYRKKCLQDIKTQKINVYIT